MPTYLIKFDYGCGELEDVVEAATQEEAQADAYQQWLEGANSQAHYAAELATSQNLTDAGFDPEEHGLEPIAE